MLPNVKFWKYAPGAALSADGMYEVSSVDRNTFMLRIEGKVFFLSCERYDFEGISKVEFNMTGEVKYLHFAGNGEVNINDIPELRNILTEGLGAIGNEAIFR